MGDKLVMNAGMKKVEKSHRTTSIVETILTIIGLLLAVRNWQYENNLIVYAIAYMLVGYGIIYVGIKSLLHGIVMHNLLITVATLGAFIIGNHIHAIGILLFFRIGDNLQNIAIDRSKKRIESVKALKVEYATIKVENKLQRVLVDDVKIGDTLIIKNGERVPLDGIITSGKSFLDVSALTGESKPLGVKIGDNILSGVINTGGVLELKVTTDSKNSTISKIVELINEATLKKSKTETFVARFSKIYTPIVVGIAIIILVSLIIYGTEYKEALNTAITFISISVPCSLVLSIPLAFYISIGLCSKKGILVKGSNYLDALALVETVVFDKTGTLTQGTFVVSKILPSNNFKEKEIVEMLCYAEYHSSHYIAKSILDSYETKLEIDISKIEEYKEIAGKGIEAVINGKKVLAGSLELLKIHHINFNANDEIGTKVFLGIDGIFAGCIILSDVLKQDSMYVCRKLRELNIKTVMLTGDNETLANVFANKLTIETVYSNLLPQDKVDMVKKIKAETKGKVLVVGDGINDAPVLAMSDIGMAMGAGSDIAIETSDIVLLTDELIKIIDAIQISQKTRTVATQIIIGTIIAKVVLLTLTTFGTLNLFSAICADLIVSLFSVLNSVRLLSVNKAIVYRMLRPLFTCFFKWWFKPIIVGKEFIPQKSAAVIAGNHKHALDPILVDISTKRTVHTLAKKELHDGIFGWFFRALGTIPVDLDAKQNPDALYAAVTCLKDGNLVNVSPEAQRNYTKEILLPFKFGAVVMAKRTNCQLVPYAITGDYKFRSANLKITFLPAICISDLDIAESNKLLFNIIEKLLIKENTNE